MYSIKFSFFKNLFFFFFRLLFRNPKGTTLHRYASLSKYQKYIYNPSDLLRRTDPSTQTLMFSVEGALLKSSSLFPYFMLVAFEAGGLIRAFLLFVLYPLICLVGEEMGLKIMVMVCFCGIKKKSFRVGRSVLPKFLLEDVGMEMFEVVKKGGKRVIGVSKMPGVMVESFLKDYLEIDLVVGRELKVINGYFVGIMEDKKDLVALDEILEANKDGHVVGISSFDKSLDNLHFFSRCKDIYLVRKSDKRSWQHLPREKYPNPLIFHDGRLAVKPTPSAILAIFMWIPFGLPLSIFRIFIGLTFPYDLALPICSYSGLRLTVSKPITPPASKNNTKGLLYVCNHRTLVDPLYLCFALKKNLTAVTYSLSRLSEILAPIRTVRLTRNRVDDGKMMERLLNQGDLVVCPEGTTCREPYLLRFSPLFAEMGDDIVPVAMNTDVSIFHGTTASGLKCFDPFFFFMNPRPIYTVQLLDRVSGSSKSHDDGQSRFDVANFVQSEIARELGFECTKLTRRDKYLVLAGNNGVTSNASHKQQ